MKELAISRDLFSKIDNLRPDFFAMFNRIAASSGFSIHETKVTQFQYDGDECYKISLTGGFRGMRFPSDFIHLVISSSGVVSAYVLDSDEVQSLDGVRGADLTKIIEEKTCEIIHSYENLKEKRKKEEPSNQYNFVFNSLEFRKDIYSGNLIGLGAVKNLESPNVITVNTIDFYRPIMTADPVYDVKIEIVGSDYQNHVIFARFDTAKGRMLEPSSKNAKYAGLLLNIEQEILERYLTPANEFIKNITGNGQDSVDLYKGVFRLELKNTTLVDIGYILRDGYYDFIFEPSVEDFENVEYNTFSNLSPFEQFLVLAYFDFINIAI